MKKASLLLIFLLLVGCEEKATDIGAGQEWAHLTGVVKYADDLKPVYMAFVRTQTHMETTTTDSNGIYDLGIALPKDQQEAVVVEIYKEGFVTVNMPAIVQSGQTTPVPVVTLERYLDSTITDTTVSGAAASIVLVSLDPDTISVSGIGGVSSSYMVCEVRDALGKAVDSLHATQVNFQFVVNPGGGASIYPDTIVTDKSGRVATTFYAGSNAGIAIVRAMIRGGEVSILMPNIVIYETGVPASINLVSNQFDSIAVKGTGANEVTRLTFVVRDGGGSPITTQRQSQVNFTILGGTGGGEYLTPTAAITDAFGQVSTSLNSGTTAGTVQILAYLDEDSSIYCTPVPVSIHSGLPDAVHFAVVPQYLNFPGFNYYGVIDSISALVGDLYANPVPMGTAVYFTSSAGIIEGSGTTNDDGFAWVRLYSGPPSPPANFPFGTITAQTIGQGGEIITDDALVLFSGVTQIYNVDPTSFDVPNGGSQTFTFRVSDQNGYPLAHGTHIVVAPTTGSVLGDIDITLPDTQSQGWTYFSFVYYDSYVNETDPPVMAAIAIQVTSPNGNASLIIGGSID
jgi:hypothetical protein